MNERIKELAEQAGATFTKGYIELSDGQLMLSDDVDVDHTGVDLAKFAELIVRECARFCEDKNSKLLGTMMKEHFGVEQ